MTAIRTIEQRYQGHQHGVICRLISPEALGQRLKPFVFLDYIHAEIKQGFGFGFHPHSGIATLTYQHGADVAYEDTAGQKGIVHAGGLEWMQAGGGVWHQGFLLPHETVTGFQLWVALPPGLEDAPSQGRYIPPEAVPVIDNVTVLLGTYKHGASPIPTASPMNYFDLVLSQGEHWLYQPPVKHTVAWCFPYEGTLAMRGETIAKDLVVFDESAGAIDIQAVTKARVLIGTAVKHDYPLVLGSSSVHTNAASLQQGLKRIETIGVTLRSQGRL